MKNIILPNKELSLLSNQLQNFNVGYTVQQIRSLDKVVKIIETCLQPFTEGLNKILTPPANQESEKGKQEDEAKKRVALEEFMKTEGEKKIICSFEDIDFEFIKLIWSRMANLSGQIQARESIIKMDDAIQKATEPVFVEKKEVKEPVIN